MVSSRARITLGLRRELRYLLQGRTRGAAAKGVKTFAGKRSEYRVLGELARGGVGVLLRLRDEDLRRASLGRDCALYCAGVSRMVLIDLP